MDLNHPGFSGFRGPVLRVGLSGLVALIALVLPAVAEAKRNVYVAHQDSKVVAFDRSASGALTPLDSSPFAAGSQPNGVTLSPGGEHLYVSNIGSDDISAFAVSGQGALSEITGSPFPTAASPFGSAVSPDGSHYFVANYFSDQVSAYEIGADGGLSPVSGAAVATGSGPVGVAVSPGGGYLYVSNNDFLNSTMPSTISAYEIGPGGSLSELTGSPFPAGLNPGAMSIAPDGRYLYAANFRSDNVAVYEIDADGALSEIADSPFATGTSPYGTAVSADGKRLFVTNSRSNDVSAFRIATDGTLTEVSGSPYAAGDEPIGVGMTPDGSHLYVANYGIGPPDPGYVPSSVSAYDIAGDGTLAALAGSPFETGGDAATFQSLAITPNQPPVASFTAGPTEVGSATAFDASSSADPDGTIARYDWDFGDGTTLPNGGPTPAHTYAAAGNFSATLTLTDNEGCSTTLVYTGQTASCNGSAVARTTRRVQVQVPVDDPAPKTKIKGKPKYKQARDTRFRFKSSIEGSTFKCKLDKADYKRCTSPKNYKNLEPGKHRFAVYAISPEGVADESPAKVKFKVKRKRKR